MLSVKLWSTRINSSRQFSGSETAAMNVEPSGVTLVGSGIRVSRAWETAWLCWKAGTVARFGVGTPFMVGQWLGSDAQIALKSPARSATDGTNALKSRGTRLRRQSWDQKKKVFFLSVL